VKVLSAAFLGTATGRKEWPAARRPEIAFVGRSNVGKSSMLNALARCAGLARVSSTPGRTRQLQFFEVAVQPSPGQRPFWVRFCDLPGYGFAKVSKTERDRWAGMVNEYLRDRLDLRAVILIVDARHPSTEVDRQALEFLRARERPVVVAATKVDKLAKSHRIPALRAAERALDLTAGSVLPFSAVESTGTDALWSRLADLIRNRSDVGHD